MLIGLAGPAFGPVLAAAALLSSLSWLVPTHWSADVHGVTQSRLGMRQTEPWERFSGLAVEEGRMILLRHPVAGALRGHLVIRPGKFSEDLVKLAARQGVGVKSANAKPAS